MTTKTLLPSNQSLFYGSARSPLVQVVPDTRWPRMWRIAWPDGQLSDPVNLARAKDAAAMIAERGPPARDRRLLHWKTKASNSPPEGPYVRSVRPGGHPPRDQVSAEVVS
jgi:hypothetical protein